MCAPEQADNPVPVQGGMQRHNNYGQMRQEPMQCPPGTIFEDGNPQKGHGIARNGDTTIDEQRKNDKEHDVENDAQPIGKEWTLERAREHRLYPGQVAYQVNDDNRRHPKTAPFVYRNTGEAWIGECHEKHE